MKARRKFSAFLNVASAYSAVACVPKLEIDAPDRQYIKSLYDRIEVLQLQLNTLRIRGHAPKAREKRARLISSAL
jgi:hypothetical protein